MFLLISIIAGLTKPENLKDGTCGAIYVAKELASFATKKVPQVPILIYIYYIIEQVYYQVEYFVVFFVVVLLVAVVLFAVVLYFLEHSHLEHIP